MVTRRLSTSLRWIAFGLMMAAATSQSSLAGDDLLQRASWEWPSVQKTREEIDRWVTTLELEDKQLETIDAIWNAAIEGGDLVEPVLDSIANAALASADFVKRCRAGKLASRAEFDELTQQALPPIVSNALRLLYGKSLAIHQLYNEAKEVLEPLAETESVGPATLLFYRAAVDYRVREFEEAEEQLAKLLERDAELPERYGTVANLMLADLKQLKPDSLDEIARIMDSITVRLEHGRAGTRVRDEEQEVIDKLSKMIEEKEKQLQQMMAQSGQGGGGNQPSAPMQDSQLPGGGGPGDVQNKKLREDSDWGNLPPKERKQALQQLGKEFPSHYRDVIEEYFRNLAKDDAAE
jgi:tetratricopeptide (TPR) repeat protein